MSHIRLPNPHLEGEDFLYHFGLSTNDDLEEKFGDVKVRSFTVISTIMIT